MQANPSLWFELALGIVALATAALVAVMIPVLLRIRATALKVESLVDRLHTDLVPLVADCRQAYAVVQEAAPRFRAGIQGARNLLDTVAEVGGIAKSFFKTTKH